MSSLSTNSYADYDSKVHGTLDKSSFPYKLVLRYNQKNNFGDDFLSWIAGNIGTFDWTLDEHYFYFRHEHDALAVKLKFT